MDTPPNDSTPEQEPEEKRRPVDEFIHRLVDLWARTDSAQAHGQHSADAHAHHLEAVQKMRELRSREDLNWLLAPEAITPVIKDLVSAEKEAKAALARATQAKREAELVQMLLKRLRRLVKSQ